MTDGKAHPKEWFSFGCTDTAGDACEVQLHQHPENRYWEPDVLAEYPFPAEQVRGRVVTITGRAAVWMYAHVAAVSAGAGATVVRVETPQPPGGSDDTSGCESKLITAGPKGHAGALLYVRLRAYPRLSREAIARVVVPRLDEIRRLRPRELAIHGRAPCEVYAEAAAVAVRSGTRRVLCWSATDGLVVVYDAAGRQVGARLPVPPWLEEAVPKPRWPVVIGVVGDPQRGKSVFSKVLDRYRERRGVIGWLLDCDAASPTPYWFLSLLQQGEAERARQLREAAKQQWTNEMEEQVVEQIRRGRDLFEVLIADLPGGNLKAQPPQRIPPGRERILSEVDAFILMDRRDQPTECQWRKELARHGLEERLVAVLWSEEPTGAASLEILEEGKPIRAVIRGLDRSREIEEFQRELNTLDQFWRLLFARVAPAGRSGAVN